MADTNDSADPAPHGAPLERAEVQLPISALARLLDTPPAAVEPSLPPPALLAARLRLELGDGPLAIDAALRVTCFSKHPSLVPLLGGELSVASQPAGEPAVVLHDGMLSAVANQGTSTVNLRLLPANPAGFALTLPACPAAMLDTSGLPAARALVLKSGTREEIIPAGQLRPLPTGVPMQLRLLSAEETRQALRPPQPSAWRWQHQALVIPGDAQLEYHLLARASATSGDGLSALIRLPAEARNITITGDDVAATRRSSGDERTTQVVVEWQTRGQLERDLEISYQMPLRPLDPAWTLSAPSAEAPDATRTRFIIAASTNHTYTADGLAGPLSSSTLPASFAKHLDAVPQCFLLEAAASATLQVGFVPRVATAAGVVSKAEWALKLEPDGAILNEGTLAITHDGPLGFLIDTPAGMRLLSCALNGRPVAPIDRGDGVLEIPLPAGTSASMLRCAFTGKVEPLDPVAGTLELSLPKTPVFVRAMTWALDLPPAYQAETSGNLTRLANEPGTATVRLAKNLSRDERPTVNLFYQRADIDG